MSLVAYGDSDSDEDHIEDEANTPSINLPADSPKQRETVRITIPSLEQFKDEETDSNATKKPQIKSGSGLFSLLPSPKYATSSITHNFTPHVLKKQKQNQKKPPEIKPPTTKKNISSVEASSKEADSDEYPTTNKVTSSNPVIDYFSLDGNSAQATNEGKDIVISETPSFLFSSLPEPCQSTESYTIPEVDQLETLPVMTPHLEPVSSSDEFVQQSWNDQCPSVARESDASSSFLNDEGFKKLKGRHKVEEINFIDVNEADQLTGKNEWLMRSLTEEKVERPSKRKHDMPTTQQKRKHQITYLAHQAKERELDLKNQWALNSRTRRETQAKYGF